MKSPITRIGSPTSDVSRLVMRGRNVLTDTSSPTTKVTHSITTAKKFLMSRAPS